MPTASRKPTRARRGSKVLKAIQRHPIAAAGIAGSAVLGAVLLTKAAKTAAKVVTINAASKGAANVVRAARKPKRK